MDTTLLFFIVLDGYYYNRGCWMGSFYIRYVSLVIELPLRRQRFDSATYHNW
uniref:Uncharacterized protein n=1 Tax=virus sp. ct9pU4 TaxID=2828248 RepID=A0A8S5RBK3_9VIRU|nr:MAG TPA: hypothetical protein [virus sp. ct9pU4]DAW07263.1 MAG TPA: hypothetical protein [Caudoviricetes sp.]